ncbi:MAG TPA: helix-turn-helix domain-containing protein [Firmicutes bacterium]|nr:helix-turn-helix domain-containing protein [Bacillota bacterium]
MSDLKTLVTESGLARLLQSFREATGLPAAVIDVNGVPILAPQSWENSALCRLVRSSEAGRSRCDLSYARAGEEAARLGDLYIFRCHVGLVNWAAPIVLQSESIGSVVCGQVVMWDIDDVFFNEVARSTGDLGLPPLAVKAAARELERVSVTRVQAAAELLYAVTTHVVRSADLVLRQRREISRQQARLGEEIQARKELEKKLRNQACGIYSRQKENELLACVRSGNRSGAKEILNEILADIFLYGPTSPEIIKARLLELSVILSRAAVEAGASLERVLGMNYRQVEELSRLDTIEDLCFWIVRVLDQFMDSVYEMEKTHNPGPVMRAVRYMRKNLMKRITLDDVAEASDVSASHLSHLFKEEMGCTVMDYLTRIRIEEAKRLMCDPRLNVSIVAEMVGYGDPAHFSKAFKRVEGISPSDYRRRSAG